MALTRGIAADAGVSVDTVMSVVCDAVQRKESRKGSGNQLESQTGVGTVSKATALTVGVITDTGATIKGVGARHDNLLQNIGRLSCPVSVATAVGDTRLEKTGDLAMAGGLSGAMDGSLVLESCADSIMPVVPTCEQLDLGYQISQGGQRARFYRDGETVQVLRKEGSLFTAPVATLAEDDSEWYECDDGLDIEWGLVAADVRVGPGSDCPDCEKCGHVDECGLSSGDRESHDMLMVPSGDVSECLAVGGVDRGTMSGLVALVVASCAAAGGVCADAAHGAGRCI